MLRAYRIIGACVLTIMSDVLANQTLRLIFSHILIHSAFLLYYIAGESPTQKKCDPEDNACTMMCRGRYNLFASMYATKREACFTCVPGRLPI